MLVQVRVERYIECFNNVIFTGANCDVMIQRRILFFHHNQYCSSMSIKYNDYGISFPQRTWPNHALVHGRLRTRH